MAVRKIKRSWWVDFQYEGIRHRKRSPENTREGAKAYEAALRHRLALGERDLRDSLSPNAPSTFKEAAWKWFDIHVKPNLKPSGRVGYESALRVHLVPAFGTLRLEDVTSFAIDAYKARKSELRKVNGEMKPRQSAKSINNQLLVLSKLLKDSVEWGWLGTSPKIAWMKEPPPKTDFLSREESDRLLAASVGSKWHDMILCALRTGMRSGELRALHWSDVDLARRVITVRRTVFRGVETAPKSNRNRQIPIADDLYRALAGRERKYELVFCGDDGRWIEAHSSYWWLGIVREKAGLQVFGWHRLRHTFASQLVEAGVSIRVVQELLGHSKITMTMRYAHVSSPMLSDAVNRLSTDKELLSPSRRGNLASTEIPSESSVAVRC